MIAASKTSGTSSSRESVAYDGFGFWGSDHDATVQAMIIEFGLLLYGSCRVQVMSLRFEL